MPLSTRDMILTDHHQSGIFSGSTGIRHQATSGKSGHLAQHFLGFPDHLLITLCLRHRGKRVDCTQLRPSDRQHLNSSIQFHRTRSQRNHGSSQRNISSLQVLHVTHHSSLRMVDVKHGLLQDFIVTQHHRIKHRTVIKELHVCSRLSGSFSENTDQRVNFLLVNLLVR